MMVLGQYGEVIYDCIGSVEGDNGLYLVVLDQYWAVLVGTWWCWVSMDTSWMVLGQYGVVLVGTCWYWVSMERNWLIHDVTRSVEGATGYLLVLGQYDAVLVGTWGY